MHPKSEKLAIIFREHNDVVEHRTKDHVQYNCNRSPIASPVEHIFQKIIVGEGNAHAFPPLAFDPKQLFLDVLRRTVWVSAETASEHHHDFLI
jgi:hypothetical protein